MSSTGRINYDSERPPTPNDSPKTQPSANFPTPPLCDDEKILDLPTPPLREEEKEKESSLIIAVDSSLTLVPPSSQTPIPETPTPKTPILETRTPKLENEISQDFPSQNAQTPSHKTNERKEKLIFELKPAVTDPDKPLQPSSSIAEEKENEKEEDLAKQNNETTQNGSEDPSNSSIKLTESEPGRKTEEKSRDNDQDEDAWLEPLRNYHASIIPASPSTSDAKIDISPDRLIHETIILLANDTSFSLKKEQAIKTIAQNIRKLDQIGPLFFLLIKDLLSKENNEEVRITIQEAEKERNFFANCGTFNKLRLTAVQFTTLTLAGCDHQTAFAHNPVPYNGTPTGDALNALGIVFYIIRFIEDCRRGYKRDENFWRSHRFWRMWDGIYWIPLIAAAIILPAVGLSNGSAICSLGNYFGYIEDIRKDHEQDIYESNKYVKVKGQLEEQILVEFHQLAPETQNLLESKCRPALTSQNFCSNNAKSNEENEEKISDYSPLIPHSPKGDQAATAPIAPSARLFLKAIKETKQKAKAAERGKLESLYHKVEIFEKIETIVEEQKEAQRYNNMLKIVMAIGKGLQSIAFFKIFCTFSATICPPVIMAGYLITASGRIGRLLRDKHAKLTELTKELDAIEEEIWDTEIKLSQKLTPETKDTEPKEKEEEQTELVTSLSESTTDASEIKNTETLTSSEEKQTPPPKKSLVSKNSLNLEALRIKHSNLLMAKNNYDRMTNKRIIGTLFLETGLTASSASLSAGIGAGINAAIAHTAFGAAFGKAALTVLTLGVAGPPGWIIVGALFAFLVAGALINYHQKCQKEKLAKILENHKESELLPATPIAHTPTPTSETTAILIC